MVVSSPSVAALHSFALYLLALFRLLRTPMTVTSAFTHLTASLLCNPFCARTFFRVWIYILLTQFATHYLGDYYDLASDRLNRFASPITGGSRQLPRRCLPPQHVLFLGQLLTIASVVAAVTLVPPPARPLALLITILAYSYSAPPFVFNHRFLGEVDAALITSVLVPLLSVYSQPATPTPHFLPLLIVPPAIIKFTLFLTLNLADRRPDWASGKRTLPVYLGPRLTAKLHYVLTVLAYVSACLLSLSHYRSSGLIALRPFVFILCSAPSAFRVSRKLAACPYSLNAILPSCLHHASLIVWAFTLEMCIRHVRLVDIRFALVLCFVYLSFAKQLRNFRFQNFACALHPKSHKIETTKVETTKVETTKVETNDSRPSRTWISASAIEGAMDPEYRQVTVVGAGVAGLTAAAALLHQGLSVRLLERRKNAEAAESGADLALWPSAITLLKTLGVSTSFFEDECFPLSTVHMCDMDFEHIGSDEASTVLKTIDMRNVTKHTGESFVLVSRKSLMRAIRQLVPTRMVQYGVNVEGVVEDEESDMAIVSYSVTDVDGNVKRETASCRIVIGADGAHSALRTHVCDDSSWKIRFCGEVCYRGMLELDKLPVDIRQQIEARFQDSADKNTMRICYGSGLRSSSGYMSSDGNSAYWWVKEVTSKVPESMEKMENCSWPEALKTLYDLTPRNALYVDAIEDSDELNRWSSPRVVLIGDAAHVVSPNMGQGACLAIEDAVVLSSELRKFWHEADGHLEAFYKYERARKGFVRSIAKEANRQLILGQLTWWVAVAIRKFMLKVIPCRILEATLRRSVFDVSDVLIDLEAYKVEKE